MPDSNAVHIHRISDRAAGTVPEAHEPVVQVPGVGLTDQR